MHIKFSSLYDTCMVKALGNGLYYVLVLSQWLGSVVLMSIVG